MMPGTHDRMTRPRQGGNQLEMAAPRKRGKETHASEATGRFEGELR